MKTKEELFDVESWLYDEYGSVEDVLGTLDEYRSNGRYSYSKFIREVLDYYADGFTSADVKQIYKDFESIGNIKYYDSSLELSDSHILWNIDADIDNWEYWNIADSFIDSFEEEYNVSDVGYDGRSGRHVVCPDTWENVVRYDELVEGMEKYQREFIDYINSNYGGSTEEPRVRYF